MTTPDTSIAIVGMAGRFPGAPSVHTLWRRLLDGYEATRRFTAEELSRAGVPEELAARPDYVAAGADLEDADGFDANFFGVPAHEARLIDPQHRLFLECAWSALEDAGHVPDHTDGRIGVFGSSSLSSYLVNVLARAEELDGDGVDYPVLLGNDKDFLATRVSYRLGLTGPSMSIQTGCSSSLTAVHLACQALLAGECELALAGGVSITFPQTAGYVYRQDGILSRDGRCRVFDAEAGGTVKGNGCAIVVLRPLEDALADRDHVYAVIRGTAVNNDGADKVGFTAPGSAGQTEVIRDALDIAGVPASEIGYVEAHGTGTALGDPIEVRALAAAHRADGPPPEHCYLGSVKANVGHLDAAAGVVGLVKAALVLHHQAIPGQPTFSEPNPQLGLAALGYEVPTEVVRPNRPVRAAAVSSFGLGGANAHAVLSAAPPAERGPVPPDSFAFVLSAADDDALRASAANLREALAGPAAPRLDDVALTLAKGRRLLAARAAFTAATHDELLSGLDRFLAGDAAEEAAPVGDLSQAWRTSLPSYPFRHTRHWVDVASAAPRAAVHPAPLDALDGVCRVLGRHLAVEVAPDDDLYELGIDSLTAVEIATSLRDELRIEAGIAALQAAATPRELAQLLQPPSPDGIGTSCGERAPVAAAAQVTTIRGRCAERKVFLVHPAGGTTICYADLARHVRDDHQMYGIDFPFEAAGAGLSVRDLAERYVACVREVQPEGPYVIGGYSFGGNVAFEMALRLQHAGEHIARIVLLDSHPPEAYVGGSADAAAFLAAFPRLLRQILPDVEAPTGFAPTSVEEALRVLRRPSWTDAMLDELERFFAVWQDNHAALKGYYPDARVDADVVLLAADQREDGEVLEQLGIRRVGKDAWRRHVVGGRLRIVPVPGNHYSIFRDPANLAMLAERYEQAVDTAITRRRRVSTP
jgi:3-oxoacyl-(acyl-carrier-protein) synthase/thioesterase domain-containing protein/acyl carrier protein